MSTETKSEPEFITEKKLAERLGLAEITLRVMRAKGTGPAYVRIGRSIRYARTDVDAFIAAARVGGK